MGKVITNIYQGLSWHLETRESTYFCMTPFSWPWKYFLRNFYFFREINNNKKRTTDQWNIARQQNVCQNTTIERASFFWRPKSPPPPYYIEQYNIDELCNILNHSHNNGEMSRLVVDQAHIENETKTESLS